jgi:hypothetical protein
MLDGIKLLNEFIGLTVDFKLGNEVSQHQVVVACVDCLTPEHIQHFEIIWLEELDKTFDKRFHQQWVFLSFLNE